MNKTLVIVESPTKAKTITRFLGSGNGIQVMASQGHVRDLPERSLGVDLNDNFKPEYELTANGKKTIKSLKQAATGVKDIYLATDPDREGEAIAWHLQEVLKPGNSASFHRITFHEITQSAIQRAFKSPGNIAYDMVDAQQARRILDRIVGYKVSPLLWRNIQKGTSAGRVQTVALRLVVEREREIQAFVPVEYWNLDAVFGTSGSSFSARLFKINDEKVQISTLQGAGKIEAAVTDPGVSHRISKVTTTPRKKTPPPPFITSTLQQAAGSALRFSASQTMRIAQELYEGIDLGSGQVGLITYMRTDSVNIAKEAQAQALDYIRQTYGADYIPEKPNVYRSRKSAQEAHEAIRPTDMSYSPDKVASYLTPQQLKIYTLIWNRFLASQMAPAQQKDHLIEVESRGGALDGISDEWLVASPHPGNQGVVCTFRAAARETVFLGFLKVYAFKEIGEEEEPDENILPQLPIGALCNLLKLSKEQCFTQPPSRYTEASLVKALEQNGVGRPSTYATTVNTIQERKYVQRLKGSLAPTDLGCRICDYLVGQMPQLFDIAFTARMEEELDQVEEGQLNWVDMLHVFYDKFQEWLGIKANVAMMPNGDILPQILSCFPEDFPFEASVIKGAKKYDDAKFVSSIRERMNQGKSLTERQLSALMFTLAKYAPTHPEVQQVVESCGLEEKVKAIQEEAGKLKASVVVKEVVPEAVALLDAMDNIKYRERQYFQKKYDDRKFVNSLKAQVSSGKGLSEAQTKALLKLSANYANVIENYQVLSANLAGTISNSAVADVTAETSSENKEEKEREKNKIETFLKELEKVQEWMPAKGHGKFKFDEKAFYESVKEQFGRKGVLSPKQLGALSKLVVKYKEQIDFEKVKALVKVDEKKSQAEILDDVCPQCGAHLVRRLSKSGKPFVGCSAFPKCRYIAKNSK